MRDRAMQALYALAVVPVAETTGDLNSYGFRDGRCCADAIKQCYNCLAKRLSARWILEADIQACFDKIDHQWILNNILIDKKILRSWLNAGYVDKGKLYPTKAGTPQGAIISPVLANMTLDGLETAVKNAVPKRAKVHVIRYADDFIVTGESKQILQQKVKPAIRSFLSQRGLNLSGEKTRITRIENGFDFLGQHLRKYGGKFLFTPLKNSVKCIVSKTRKIIKSHLGSTTAPFPVLRPELVLLEQIPLGQAPSLHNLRQRESHPLLFDCFYGTYGPVRLPVSVHRCRVPLGFTARAVAPSATTRHRTSRFPCGKLPCVHRVSDHAGS
jgi:RNA-directed DNA polymerase